MAALFFGVTKGLSGFMGMSALMFTMAVSDIEMRQDMAVEAVEIQPQQLKQADPPINPLPAE